jgi:putative ATP-grasp target RiPP
VSPPLPSPSQTVDHTLRLSAEAGTVQLTLAVPFRKTVRINPEDLAYDPERQIGLIHTAGEMVPLSKHTDGPTNTQTNSDGRGGYDSDSDHRED